MKHGNLTHSRTLARDLVSETRCGVVEVLHQGVIAIANIDGVVTCYGNGSLLVPTRSTLKPFILGLLLDTLLREQKFSNRELAVMSSSHNGQRAHVEVVSHLLHRFGMSEAELECGSHPAFCTDSSATPAGNNCSGKHALFLIACKVAGWDTHDYIEPSSRIQTIVKEMLERNVFTNGMHKGIDGCSVPNYAVTVSELARAYALYAHDLLGPGLSRVRQAHLAEPEMVGGSDCLDTLLIRNYGLAAKSGSDGVWAAGIPNRKFGIVVKTFSGSEQAAQVALLEVLQRMSVVNLRDDPVFSQFVAGARKSWAGKIVGEIQTCFAAFPPQ